MRQATIVAAVLAVLAGCGRRAQEPEAGREGEGVPSQPVRAVGAQEPPRLPDRPAGDRAIKGVGKAEPVEAKRPEADDAANLRLDVEGLLRRYTENAAVADDELKGRRVNVLAYHIKTTTTAADGRLIVRTAMGPRYPEVAFYFDAKDAADAQARLTGKQAFLAVATVGGQRGGLPFLEHCRLVEAGTPEAMARRAEAVWQKGGRP